MQVARSRLPQGQDPKIAQNSGASMQGYMDSLKNQGSTQVANNPTASTPILPKIRMQVPTTGVSQQVPTAAPSTRPKVTMAQLRSPQSTNLGTSAPAQKVAYPKTPAEFVAPPLDVPVPPEPVGLDPSSVQLNPLLVDHNIETKEVSGPAIEPSLAYVINNYFSKACTDVLSLKIKDAYESLMRPQNAAHLIKTEMNSEFKHPQMGISKSGNLKDGHARGVQNSIIRLAVALAQIANEVLSPKDPNSGPDPIYILDRAMTGLKVAAYGSQRCNAFRRFLLRPHLNNCYQYICGEAITQLSVLIAPNLQDYIKLEKERTNQQVPLTKMGSKAIQKQKRKRGGEDSCNTVSETEQCSIA